MHDVVLHACLLCTIEQEMFVGQIFVLSLVSLHLHLMLTNLSASAQATMNEVKRELKKFCHPKVAQYKVCVCCLTGMFYYTLCNLPPHVRSTQRSTLLLVCVSSTNIEEYGFERILEGFI